MEAAKEKRDKFSKELKKAVPGWKTHKHKDNISCILLVSENIDVTFFANGKTEIVFRRGGRPTTSPDATLLRSVLKMLSFDPAYQTFLMNKKLDISIEKTTRLCELLDSSIELAPGGEVAEKLKEHFEGLRTELSS